MTYDDLFYLVLIGQPRQRLQVLCAAFRCKRIQPLRGNPQRVADRQAHPPQAEVDGKDSSHSVSALRLRGIVWECDGGVIFGLREIILYHKGATGRMLAIISLGLGLFAAMGSGGRIYGPPGCSLAPAGMFG